MAGPYCGKDCESCALREQLSCSDAGQDLAEPGAQSANWQGAASKKGMRAVKPAALPQGAVSFPAATSSRSTAYRSGNAAQRQQEASQRQRCWANGFGFCSG